MYRIEQQKAATIVYTASDVTVFFLPLLLFHNFQVKQPIISINLGLLLPKLSYYYSVYYRNPWNKQSEIILSSIIQIFAYHILSEYF